MTKKKLALDCSGNHCQGRLVQLGGVVTESGPGGDYNN